jgi:hypothetical protein
MNTNLCMHFQIASEGGAARAAACNFVTTWPENVTTFVTAPTSKSLGFTDIVTMLRPPGGSPPSSSSLPSCPAQGMRTYQSPNLSGSVPVRGFRSSVPNHQLLITNHHSIPDPISTQLHPSHTHLHYTKHVDPYFKFRTPKNHSLSSHCPSATFQL